MRGKEEASEQRTEEVVAVAGAQRLLPTAAAPAPAQSQLAKEKQGWQGGALGLDIIHLVFFFNTLQYYLHPGVL